MSKWIKDVKVAKTTVKEENVVFNDSCKIESGDRLKFHLKQMANLVHHIGSSYSAEGDYRDIQKELVGFVIDRTSDVMLKDALLDIKQVPRINLDREIPYCIPPSDGRDNFVDIDMTKHLKLIPSVEEATSAIPLDVTSIVNDRLYDKRPGKNNENQLDSPSVTQQQLVERMTDMAKKAKTKKEKITVGKKALEEMKRNLEDKDFDDFKKRSAASKKGWKTRKRNASLKQRK